MAPRSAASETIEIVNPVAGLRPPEHALARRLTGLSGKRIAIVHSPLAFSRAVADRLSGLLQARSGVADVTLVVRRHYIMPLTAGEIEGLRARVDAVILGVAENRPGGAIAAWDAVEFETRGLPTAIICSTKGAVLGQTATASVGAPDLPMVAIPNAVGGDPRASAEAVLDEVVHALTDPPRTLSARYRGLHASREQIEQALGISPNAGTERLRVKATPEAMGELLAGLRCWDGLPVVPPTPERVKAMLSFCGRTPDEVVAHVPPRWGAATLAKVAACAVMAGCRPEYMPVLLAAVRALPARDLNAVGVLTGTGPQTPLVLVHGPVRGKIGVNSGANALGPGVQANATIGRAMRFVLAAIGGCIAGLTDYATLGQPGKYTLCMGENQEDSPWQPLHADRGLDRETSAVTVIFLRGNFDVFTVGQQPESILRTIVNGLRANSHGNVYYGGELAVFLGPDFAQRLAAAGYSKADAQRYIFERAHVRAGDLPAEDMQAVRNFRYDEFPDFSADTLIPPARRAEDVLLVVAGGHGIHITISPTAGGLSRSQTVPVEG
ncbi:MAG: hypothetical protein Q7T26_05100 [Dehalococcoidia bacterium]|nr:hypothetical protein [Dehalococcoidia bacterium]